MGNSNTKRLNQVKSNLKIKNSFKNLILLFITALLFFLSHPNFLSNKGFFLLAYFMYFPLLILVNRLKFRESFFYGLLYGVLAYCLFTYWLATFHPMGILVISFLYGFQYAILFPILVSVKIILKKQNLNEEKYIKKLYFLQWLILCAYEFVKTFGFAGFHYGLAAYTQWTVKPLIQIVDLVGVWGLSALVLFPSALLFAFFARLLELKNNSIEKNTKFSKIFFFESFKLIKIPALIWLIIFSLSLIYGFIVQKNYANYPKKTIIAIQSNVDPWIGDYSVYKNNLLTLMRLTNQALDEAKEKNLKPELIVWPETAFIPRIEWHYAKRLNPESFEQVKMLLDFIEKLPIPILLGNDYGIEGYDKLGDYRILDYNSALLFFPGKNVIPPKPEMYKKNHLVPFTEHFPFEKTFPKIYKALLNGDTHMWEKGIEKNILEIEGLAFGAPICFEDTFGYIGREFVNNGAQAFVNMSNDAWSKSLPCQYQHLSMAIFRSVENRVPQVRSTASGQTCFIDPNGRITSMAKPFTEAYIIDTIPIIENLQKSLYTLLGDYLGIFFVLLAVIFYTTQIIRIIKKDK